MRQVLAGQFVTSRGAWKFGVSDRNAVAWVTVGGYAIAAAFCFRAFVVARAAERELTLAGHPEARKQHSLRRLWLAIAIVLVVLGINKQLDLQSWFIEEVRNRAYRDGWYDDRRRYQTAFIGLMALVSFIATGVLGFIFRHVLRRVWLAILGLGMLVLFVIIRASSFHYVDKVLALGTVRINWILEFTGIGLMVVAVLRWLVTERRIMRVARAEAAETVAADTVERIDDALQPSE